jgi:hypothetical protein
MTNQEILSLLASAKSADRRRAAKQIGKLKLTDCAEPLYQAYLKERTDKRTWETQVAMIIALGILDYKNALKDIEPIVRANEPHDMITYAAAQTYVRLTRKSLADASPVIELLQSGSLSTVAGCLDPLGYDKMQPNENEIRKLIELVSDLHNHKNRIGYEYGDDDFRYGLAAACAGWNKDLTKDFLESCIKTGDEPVKYVAQNSLKGKYVKLR